VKKILAVDPGTIELGLYDGDNSATIVTSRKNPRPERLAFMASKLADFIAIHGPYDFIVYEEQFVRGNAATKALYGVVGVIECVSISCGAGVMALPQSTLRKWAQSEGPEGLKGKELYQKVAVSKDARLAADTSVTEHVFDAACIYHFIQAKGTIQ